MSIILCVFKVFLSLDVFLFYFALFYFILLFCRRASEEKGGNSNERTVRTYIHSWFLCCTVVEFLFLFSNIGFIALYWDCLKIMKIGFRMHFECFVSLLPCLVLLTFFVFFSCFLIFSQSVIIFIFIFGFFPTSTGLLVLTPYSS